MAANHTWRCTPGYQICVIGRGDIQFEYPQGWHVVPTDNSIKVHDRPPPDDDCVLEVSVLRFPPLREDRPSIYMLLQEGLLKSGHFIPAEEIQEVQREDVQIVWAEYRKMDEQANREAVWRHGFGHMETLNGHLYAILTFGFWPELREKFHPLWEHVLKTLIMGRYVEDPTRGPRYH
jgi:hypothetical protein